MVDRFPTGIGGVFNVHLLKSWQKGGVQMTFAENLMQMRKLRGLSQEELGAAVGVSRQTVSKWELGSTTPELEKLMALSDYFNVSLDVLVGREQEKPSEEQIAGTKIERQMVEGRRYEYRSKREIHGLPLVHVNLSDRGIARAKGIIAIGNVAAGVVAIGAVSIGVLALGAVSIGVLALGAVAFGLISAAAIAMGILAFGSIAIGYLAVGSCAIGVYAVGEVASAVRIAIGERAKGALAIHSQIFEQVYLATPAEEKQSYLAEVMQLYEPQMLELCPGYLKGIFRILKAFLIGSIT